MSTKKNGQEPVVFQPTYFDSTIQLSPKSQPDDDEDYNPFEHRTLDKPNSTFGALAHLLKSSLGTGILAMPAAFKNAGLLFGFVTTLIVGFLCTHCVHILVQTSIDICKKTKTPQMSFSETAEKVFQNGPFALRKWSSFVKQFVDYGLMGTYYSANCVYIVFISTSICDIINYNFGIDWDVRIYIAIMVIPVLIMSQIRELKYLVPFSALANLFIIITFGITIYFIFNEPLDFSDKDLFSSWEKLPLFFSTVIFAMEGIGMVMPVANNMRHPEKFLGCAKGVPGVLNSAMLTVVLLYASLGFFGYVKYGEIVKGSITLNLPEEYPIAQVAQVLIALAILFTFGLQYYAPNEILFEKVKDKIPKEKHNLFQIVTRGGIVFLLAGIAAAVPELEPFIGLVGAIFFSILGIFVPSIIETVFLWPHGLGKYKWRLWKNALLALFSVIALVSGSIASISEIIKMYTPNDENGDEKFIIYQ